MPNHPVLAAVLIQLLIRRRGGSFPLKKPFTRGAHSKARKGATPLQRGVLLRAPACTRVSALPPRALLFHQPWCPCSVWAHAGLLARYRFQCAPRYDSHFSVGALHFAGSLFLWRRHLAAGGEILRTTLAGGHLMFADTLLLKTMMDILFVDARSPGDDVKSPRATGVPFAARATTRPSGLGNNRLGLRDSRCSEDIYVSGTVTLVLSL